MNSKFKQILVAVAAVSFMVGCNKKSDDGAIAQPLPPPPTTCIVGQVPPVGYICMNGQLIPSAVGGTNLANLTFESTYMNGTLMINAQGPVNGVAYPGQSSLYSYNGAVTLSGTLQAANTICINGTGIPGGYAIQGTANLSNSVLSSVVLSAVGPASLTFQNAVLIVYQDSRVGIGAQVLNNGAYCGWVQTY